MICLVSPMYLFNIVSNGVYILQQVCFFWFRYLCNCSIVHTRDQKPSLWLFPLLFERWRQTSLPWACQEERFMPYALRYTQYGKHWTLHDDCRTLYASHM